MEDSFFANVLRSNMTLSGKSQEDELASLGTLCDTSEPYTMEGRSVMGKVLRVVDGDSLRVAIPICGSVWTFAVRIDGIDCPEIRTKSDEEKILGHMAKDHVESLVLGKIVALKLGEFDSFGRLLGKIHTKEGVDVAEDLILNGMAVEYTGGKRKGW